MYVLECGKYNHIVDWKLDAESNEQHFIVYDIDVFTETILPTFFKVAKYDSFQRKLYRWGFLKTRRTRADKLQLPKSACYAHPFFRQGDYNRASQMTCSGVDVEFCKTEQKKRKRQQSEKVGSKVSKKLPASKNNAKKTTEQKSISSKHSLGNFQQLMAHGPFRDMEAIPSLLPSTMRMNGCERIEDASSTVPALSRDSSTLNSQHKTRVLPSCSRNSSSDDDISKLLARVQDQRQLQRIQQNNLMREKLLKEMQNSLMMTTTSDSIGVDYRQKRREEEQRIINNALDVLKLSLD